MDFIVWFVFLELWRSVQADSSCVDFQGRVVATGQNFTPNKLLPCIECLCISGVGVRCGPPVCLGRINCALPRWNSTNCCNRDCFERSVRYGGFQTQPFWPSRSRVDEPRPSPYFGASVNDDAAAQYRYNAQRNNEDTQVVPYGEDNVTSVSATHTQNMPSPYYPILIGLISCAPVALCIICVNAVRKYFALRNQFPTASFFPRRRRTTPRRGSSGERRFSQPGVFTEPPPSYKDIGSTKYRLSEDLPRYEDVIKHERDHETKVFATTSSAQFMPPERVNFAFSTVDETVPPTAIVFPLAAAPVEAFSSQSNDSDPAPPEPTADPSWNSKPEVPVSVVPTPAPLTAAPPNGRRHTVIPESSSDPREGIDNPAHIP